MWGACLAGVLGLLAVRIFVSFAPIIGVLAVLANPNLKRDIGNYFRNRAALWPAATLLFLLITGLYTSDLAGWRHELLRYLPWATVPLAFAVAVPLAPRQRVAVGAFFVLGTALLGLATLSKYFLDPGSATEAVRIGQNMAPVTPIFHITFGAMLALTFFGGLLLRRTALAPPWLRLLFLVAAVAAAATLHILAYRTGLLVLYAGLLAYALRLLLQKHIALGVALSVLVVAAPWAAYTALPTVRERVSSSIWDVQQYALGHDINDYSLARRLAAFETAGAIIAQHWLVGVGPADTQAAMREQYRWQDFGLRPVNQVEVHNQYVLAVLGGGVVGLGLLLALLFWPLTQAHLRRNPYVCFFLLVEATAMLVDSVTALHIGRHLLIFGYAFLVVAAEAAHQQKKRALNTPQEASPLVEKS
ncbi:hypothetical protein BEN47_00105 [Hymenobacter lapidarius]|uniref:O-antigen ligase-related domain-containing protein n=1 Tax=Hymenobacter lapidarius TaxID=1908237 RepID=A0A1G1T9S1_9BACT|nr:hypothetical protein BEN47_00105 [Hymenobacter lapidarius]